MWIPLRSSHLQQRQMEIPQREALLFLQNPQTLLPLPPKQMLQVSGPRESTLAVSVHGSKLRLLSILSE
jgi:hypothetical protein